MYQWQKSGNRYWRYCRNSLIGSRGFKTSKLVLNSKVLDISETDHHNKTTNGQNLPRHVASFPQDQNPDQLVLSLLDALPCETSAPLVVLPDSDLRLWLINTIINRLCQSHTMTPVNSSITNICKSRVTTLLEKSFSMTYPGPTEMNFHDLSALHFPEINETWHMNAYQN